MIEPIILSMADGLGSVMDLWNSFYGFIAFAIFTLMGIGFMSRSMAVAGWGGYIGFAFLALETGDTLLMSILTVTLIIMFVALGFKFWRFEGFGGGTP